jgi:hypothetical protein
MPNELPDWFVRVFAMPRLSPYVSTAKDHGVSADRFYLWNLQVSAAFYDGPLHCLEIGLRNALNARLSGMYGRPDWWSSAPLAPHDALKIGRVRDDLLRRSGTRIGPDDVVAELAFGFWVSLLSRRYDRYLRVPALHQAFPGYSGAREPLRDNLEAMRLLRNRVAHYEPIHHRDLAADHQKIYRLLGYIEPAAVAWLRTFDRVPDLLARRPLRMPA